jgi:hypothetical protein
MGADLGHSGRTAKCRGEGFEIVRLKSRRVGVRDVLRQHRTPLIGPGQPPLRQVEQADPIGFHVQQSAPCD